MTNLIVALVKNSVRFCLVLLIVFTAHSTLYAQQTIINLPSADQTPAGHIFALHESQIRFWEPDTFWSMTNFLTYGIDDRFEVALTTYNTQIAGSMPFKPYNAIGFGYKTAQPLFEHQIPDWELKATLGQMLTISNTGLGAGVWSYGHLSWRLPVLRTRLAAGISMGSRQIFGDAETPQPLFSTHKINFIASLEQPITNNLGIVAEWFAGRHEMGDFVPGIIYHSKDIVLILGFKIANGSPNIFYKGNGIIFEIGHTFDSTPDHDDPKH